MFGMVFHTHPCKNPGKGVESLSRDTVPYIHRGIPERELKGVILGFSSAISDLRNPGKGVESLQYYAAQLVNSRIPERELKVFPFLLFFSFYSKNPGKGVERSRLNSSRVEKCNGIPERELKALLLLRSIPYNCFRIPERELKGYYSGVRTSARSSESRKGS